MLRKIIYHVLFFTAFLFLAGCMDEDDTNIIPRDCSTPLECGTAPVATPPTPASGDYISDASCFNIRDVFQAPPKVCYRGSDLDTAYSGSIPSAFGACSAASPICCENDIFRVPDLNLLHAISTGTSYTVTLDEFGTNVNSAGAGQTGMVKMLFILTERFIEPAVALLYNALSGPGGPYRGIIRSLCVLAIMFYAGSIALGMTHANPYVLILLAL